MQHGKAIVALALVLVLGGCAAEIQRQRDTPRRIGLGFYVANINFWRAGGSARGPNNEFVGSEAAIDAAASFISSQFSGLGVIGLQEINTETPRDLIWPAAGEGQQQIIDDSELWDQPAEIARRIGRDWTSYFGFTRGNSLGRGGNALLTNIAFTKPGAELFGHDPEFPQYWGGIHNRGMTRAKLDFGQGRRLWVVTTHIGGEPDDGAVAMRQVFELLGHVKRYRHDYPVLVMGDFNIRAALPRHADAFASLNTVMATDVSGFSPIVRRHRVHIYLYDPENKLEVLQAGDDFAAAGGVQFSDHHIVWARIMWR